MAAGTYDFGQARRQQAAKPTPNELVITDANEEVLAKYTLVARIPAEFFDLGAAGKLAAAFALLFEDERDARAFLDEYRPSFEEIGAIVADLYPGLGGDLGKALASGSKRTSTGTP